MKRLILVLLLIPAFAYSQRAAISDRWKLIFKSEIGDTQTYIDTQTIEHLDYFEARANVYSAWIKSLSDFSNGIFHKEDIVHMVVDIDTKQIGIKSLVSKKDGKTLANKTYIAVDWNDIVPETNGETLLNYCKNLHK